MAGETENCASGAGCRNSCAMTASQQTRAESLKELACLGKEAFAKPSTFYRHIHPELFSDSKTCKKVSLTKALLEFHLDQLTVNKKEYEFEEFCLRLAEREICSNLIPQTGPVGGGDSKVDSSTYPVADELREQRYWSGKAKPASEDWGFAFSAKKAWQDKARADVAKIASLPRKFHKVFFVTNQPARDKIRAKLEAELIAKFGIQVSILDRTWIVRKVLDNRLEELAASCLGLDVAGSEERNRGPRDTAAEQQLQDLLRKLEDPEQAPQSKYALAQDFLEAAEFATQLERPRSKVDGLFLQAQELALKTRHRGIIIRTHYEHAWKSYFYFDDAAAAEKILERIEGLLPEVTDADEAELFSNLFTVFHTANLMGYYKQSDEKLKARSLALRQRLEAISSDQTRPNNALYAETILHLWNLKEARFSKEVAQKTFAALKKCLKRSDGLGAYPLLRFAEIWEFFGEWFCDDPGYAELQEDMQRVISHRFGETEAGQRQLKFGLQLLEKQRPLEALKQLGEAHLNLAKEETLDDGVRATYACSFAYGLMGLKWAARMETLSAAHIALNSTERFHEIPLRGFLVAMRMAWIELQLGRVAPFLAWRNFMHGLLQELKALRVDAGRFNEELKRQDGCLGCFFLKAPADETSEISELDRCVDAMDLSFAYIALLCVTGRKEIALKQFEKEGFGEADLDSLIEMSKKQPAIKDLPDHFCGEMRTICEFKTKLFGVTYYIRCRNKLGPLLFSENLLGVLESAFAMAEWGNFAFVVDEVRLFVDETGEGQNPPETNFEHFGCVREQKLIWKPDMIAWMRDNVVPFRKFLFRLLLEILFTSTVDPMEDIKKELEIWEKQKSFERALNSSPTSVALLDLLGLEKYDLNNWINSAPPPKV